jgi:curved DNA-binding protein CbpA
MSDPYLTLGVSRQADAATIKDAFRSLASQHHPDRGGDSETMADINAAYELLSDPERRRRFDATGSSVRPPSLDSQAIAAISQACNVWMGSEDGHNVVQFVGMALSIGRAQIQGNLKKLDRLEPRIRRELGRLKRHGSGDNFIAGTLQSELDKVPLARVNLEAQLGVMVRAEEMMRDYSIEEIQTLAGPLGGWREISWR